VNGKDNLGNDDRRLIEDFLPIQAISAEASREKSVRKGHISTLHLWWARRPLVACRAAVYGALVPASKFVPENGPDNKKQSLGRANAAKFIERLCKYPGNPTVIKEAQRHILEAHAERLTEETCLRAGTHRQAGKKVTVEDIEEGCAPLPAPRLGRFFIYVIKCSDDSFCIGQTDNIQRRFEEHRQGKVEWTACRQPLQIIHYEELDSREAAVAREKELKTGFGREWLKREYAAGRLAARQAGRPKVLDMFAGGGAIPLEALRLGCEAYALDLNPVAHIIQLCTLVYLQKYGKPDPNIRGMTGKPQAGSLSHQTTWGGLADEVRYWGEWVLKKVNADLPAAQGPGTAQAGIGDLHPLIPDPEYRKKEQEKNGGAGFQPVQQDFFRTQRNLPHWQIGGSTYFVTFQTKGIELTPGARTIVLNSCRHFDGERYNLWSAVVMPDHVHLLLQPTEIEKGKWHLLSSILHSIKSFTAKKVNAVMSRTGTVWQDESFDRIIRDENEFLEKWNYIRNNPVKKGLVNSPGEWIGFHECTGKMPVPLGSVDGPSRFYVLWRYAYKAAEMDAGEAIVFTYGQNVELDGQNGLSSGSRALVEKKKGKYRLLDFSERGDDEKLGMPKDDLPACGAQAGGKAAPLIDILHRILWLVENEPRNLNSFLDEARPDRERLCLVAQTLAGTALEGRQAGSLSHQHTLSTTPAEAAALNKLVANWRTLIEARLSDVDLKTGQRKLFQ